MFEAHKGSKHHVSTITPITTNTAPYDSKKGSSAKLLANNSGTSTCSLTSQLCSIISPSKKEDFSSFRHKLFVHCAPKPNTLLQASKESTNQSIEVTTSIIDVLLDSKS